MEPQAIGWRNGLDYIPDLLLNQVASARLVDTPHLRSELLAQGLDVAQSTARRAARWAESLAPCTKALRSDDIKRGFYKNWYRSKKAFTQYAKKHADDSGKSVACELERIRKYCTVVRVLAHTQIRKTGLSQKKVHLMGISKVEFARDLFEKPIEVNSVFEQDVIAVTKGHGFEGVTHRKDHEGLRKVTCISGWHSSKVMLSVAHAGQSMSFFLLCVIHIHLPVDGYHHRTELNKKIYRIGSSTDDANALTKSDNDFLMLKGSIPGTKKRAITIRKSLMTHTSRRDLEKVELTFIDSSSKFGHVAFQTFKEKAAFLGVLKVKSQ
ncbi:60S ribosomal protein L3 [Mycena leptocephala]|nr:60S ribosomal protein L3 [Mycena leptocephala]